LASHKLNQIAAYLRHLNRAQNLEVLPPEYRDTWQPVWVNSKEERSFASFEARRKQLKQDHRLIEVNDFGTGKKGKRRISSIAAHSLISPFWGKVFFRLVEKLKPKTVLELGTSLGISGLYLTHALEGSFFTLEGDSQIASIAKETLKGTKSSILVGNIEKTLPDLLLQLSSLDFVFFDANHAYEPTLRYFEWCLSKSTQSSIFIFDDIYWSKGMELAWQRIKEHPKVVLSLDFFSKGVVLFDQRFERRNFYLKTQEILF
jgi:predicted O-methyltransferase YrrM